MPIRPDLRHLYAKDWPQISQRVRFEREGGRCQGCGRTHGQVVRKLPDGRYFDGTATYWKSSDGTPTGWPTLADLDKARVTQVWLACAHLDNDPTNNADENLAALCQRCHLDYDAVYHKRQRRITHMRKRALGDLFDGVYVSRVTCTGM